MVPTMHDTGWFKSTYSNGGSDDCVEVRMIRGSGVGVRDTKNRAGGGFWMPSRAWATLVAQVKGDGLDQVGR
jgi:hypothetical protein